MRVRSSPSPSNAVPQTRWPRRLSRSVPLPNDEMKGRIIGREGRNIRALEAATGVDLIIDDTPEAVILSGFDPVRREIARLALTKLILDGRIHPARIEDVVAKARQEVDIIVREAGEQAALEANVHGLQPELLKILGRLHFRTSYGQNVLAHSVEVSILAATIAHELGADVNVCKTAALLHDMGKAIDQEVEGPHAIIGGEIARRFGKSPKIIHAMVAHHATEAEPQSLEAAIVQAADAISAARPGARRETIDLYIKRLEALENIANSFTGVEKSFAIQAGREVRIIVKPEEIDEFAASRLASDIALAHPRARRSPWSSASSPRLCRPPRSRTAPAPAVPAPGPPGPPARRRGGRLLVVLDLIAIGLAALALARTFPGFRWPFPGMTAMAVGGPASLIVVVNYRTAGLTIDCLRSLAAEVAARPGTSASS